LANDEEQEGGNERVSAEKQEAEREQVSSKQE
jgi:hypothetical protein